jgi:hypothetical protein
MLPLLDNVTVQVRLLPAAALGEPKKMADMVSSLTDTA